MTEQFANNASSTLNGGIDNLVTTLIVTDASKFPTSGNFRLLIGTNPSTAEIVIVTGVSGTTFTVIRGQENTTASSWLSGTTVTHILTAGGLNQGTTGGGDLSGSVQNASVISITGNSGTLNISPTGATITWNKDTVLPTIKHADETVNSTNGDLLTIQAQNATGTSSTGGSITIQSGTGTTTPGNVNFNVGSGLAGYFDSNKTFRAGLNPSSNISVLGGTNNEPGNGIFCYNAGGFSTVTNASGTSSTEAIVSIFNTAAGGSLTTGLRLVGAGSANGNADWVSNGVIEQVGESTSALVFSSLTGAGASRATTGRIYRSGAWTVGSASNNNTSSGAQAGLTGPLINISSASGTATTTANQALLYNVSGSARLQGNTEARFEVGTNLAGYFDSNRVLRVGPNASSTVSAYTSGVYPLSTDSLFLNNTAGNAAFRMASGATGNSSVIDVMNVAGGASATVSIRLFAAGTTNATTGFAGNGIVEQVGASTSAMVFSKVLGDGTGRATTGRIYQTGAWGIGDASNNNTSSGAQAGLTGPLINLSSSTGTMTSVANQALLFNQSGDMHVQGNTSVRFDIGSTLGGYFDSNKTFRSGASATSSVTYFTSQALPRNQQDALYIYDASNPVQAFLISGLASSRSIMNVLNTSAGSTSTIGMRFQAPGNSDISYTNIAGNANIEQIGSSTSSLLFTSVLGDGTTRTGLGRMYKSGAWTVGDATNQNTSSGAQAGLTGPLLNLGAITSGTLTSTTNQSIIYNSAGTAILQGHVGHNFIANTTTVASTSTSKFITNVGRRIATNVQTANYTVTTSDEVILVGSLATSITITLPASPTAGDTYTIKDQGGTAGTFNIIVSGNGSNIDGASTYTMNLSYESITLVYGNGTWSII